MGWEKTKSYEINFAHFEFEFLIACPCGSIWLKTWEDGEKGMKIKMASLCGQKLTRKDHLHLACERMCSEAAQ